MHCGDTGVSGTTRCAVSMSCLLCEGGRRQRGQAAGGGALWDGHQRASQIWHICVGPWLVGHRTLGPWRRLTGRHQLLGKQRQRQVSVLFAAMPALMLGVPTRDGNSSEQDSPPAHRGCLTGQSALPGMPLLCQLPEQ